MSIDISNISSDATNIQNNDSKIIKKKKKKKKKKKDGLRAKTPEINSINK